MLPTHANKMSLSQRVRFEMWMLLAKTFGSVSAVAVFIGVHVSRWQGAAIEHAKTTLAEND